MDQKLFPSILRVLIEAKDQKANRSAIVQSIQDKLQVEGTPINNLNDEVKKILQHGVDFGLFQEKNDCYSLIFRPYTITTSTETDQENQATTSKQFNNGDDINALTANPPNRDLPNWASDSDELSENEEFNKFTQEIVKLKKSDLFNIFQALKKPDPAGFCTYPRTGRKRGFKSKKNYTSRFRGKSRSPSRNRRRKA